MLPEHESGPGQNCPAGSMMHTQAHEIYAMAARMINNLYGADS